MDEEEVLPVKETKKMSQAKKKKQTKNKISWVGEPIKVCDRSYNKNLDVHFLDLKY